MYVIRPREVGIVRMTKAFVLGLSRALDRIDVPSPTCNAGPPKYGHVLLLTSYYFGYEKIREDHLGRTKAARQSRQARDGFRRSQREVLRYGCRLGSQARPLSRNRREYSRRYFAMYGKETVSIISMRPASKAERELYEANRR